MNATTVETQLPDVCIGWQWSGLISCFAGIAILSISSCSIIYWQRCQLPCTCIQSHNAHCSWVAPISQAKISFKLVHFSQSSKENRHRSTTAERHQDLCILWSIRNSMYVVEIRTFDSQILVSWNVAVIRAWAASLLSVLDLHSMYRIVLVIRSNKTLLLMILLLE